MIDVKSSGNFNNTRSYLKSLLRGDLFSDLDRYGRMGVNALSNATPRASGKTANSWGYTIAKSPGKVTLKWTNHNIVDGVQVAILIQYGHGTGTGGYVAGQDYINPAIKPIFDQIIADIRKKVNA